jgi:LPS-assembly lipoprotein
MKKLLTLTLTLALFSCGFRPMHGPDRQLQSELRDIYIAPISGTNGIDLRNALRAKWGTDNSMDARYILWVNLNQPETILKALQITGDATWQEVRMTARYELRDTKTGEIIVTAFDTASESYTFVTDLVAAQASYNNAVQNAIQVLAKQIETRINARLASQS